MKFFWFLCFSCLLVSCSLDYGESQKSTVTVVPEMIIMEPEITRVEKGRRTMWIEAASLELFKDDDSFYSKGISFKQFNAKGAVSAVGSAGYLYADNKNGFYTLLDGVSINSLEHSVQLSSPSFRWDNSTEQLCSGKSDVVTVIRSPSNDNIRLVAKGTGFSASMLRMEYMFKNRIEGSLSTE